MQRWTASLLAVALAGCATVPGSPVGSERPALPAELLSYYEYPKQPIETHVESVQQKSGFQIQRLRLTFPNAPNNRPIRMDWYRSDKPGRLPVVVLSPILAGNDLYVREFAHFFSARGLHALIVYRPKEVFSPDRELKDVETHFHESVIGLRQAIDWLQTQKEVHPSQIGCYGISLGAILTTILTAVEPRIKASVLGLPAGQIPEIIMSTQDKAIRKRRRAYLEKQGWSQERALQELKKVLISEPMRFAPGVTPSRVLVIAGLFDRVLGFHRSMDLWRAMGRPKLIVLPTGHYSAYLATPYLKMATYSFLKRSLTSI